MKNKDSFKNDIANVSQYTKVISKLGEGGTGEVFMLEDKDGNHITKKVYTKRRIEHLNLDFPREVNILKTLSNEKHFPELLYFDVKKHIIYMTLCGEKLSKNNVPDDWKKQLKEIVDILKKYNISHNSTSINNTCVKDGVMYFIDFCHSGKYKPTQRNLTKKIINEAVTFEDAYDSSKTRHKGKKARKARKALKKNRKENKTVDQKIKAKKEVKEEDSEARKAQKVKDIKIRKAQKVKKALKARKIREER